MNKVDQPVPTSSQPSSSGSVVMARKQKILFNDTQQEVGQPVTPPSTPKAQKKSVEPPQRKTRRNAHKFRTDSFDAVGDEQPRQLGDADDANNNQVDVDQELGGPVAPPNNTHSPGASSAARGERFLTSKSGKNRPKTRTIDSRLVPIQTVQAAAVATNFAPALEIKDPRVDEMKVELNSMKSKLERIDRRDEKKLSPESSYKELFPVGLIDLEENLIKLSDKIVHLIGQDGVENLQIVSLLLLLLIEKNRLSTFIIITGL